MINLNRFQSIAIIDDCDEGCRPQRYQYCLIFTLSSLAWNIFQLCILNHSCGDIDVGFDEGGDVSEWLGHLCAPQHSVGGWPPSGQRLPTPGIS